MKEYLSKEETRQHKTEQAQLNSVVKTEHVKPM